MKTINLDEIWILTKTHFKTRNKNSFFGLLWYFLNPLVYFATIYFLFSNNLGSDIENFHLYVLIGIVTWTFFSSATTEGMNSLKKYRNLVRKTNINRKTLVLSSVFSVFLNNIFEWIIVLSIIFFVKGFSLGIILFPILILILIFISISASLILSIINSYYEDVKSIWKNLLIIGWFITPIFYSTKIISSEIEKFYFLNPITTILENLRGVLIESSINYFSIFYLFIISIIILVLCNYIFDKTVINLAEII